jgi:hypothetical protein
MIFNKNKLESSQAYATNNDEYPQDREWMKYHFPDNEQMIDSINYIIDEQLSFLPHEMLREHVSNYIDYLLGVMPEDDLKQLFKELVD